MIRGILMILPFTLTMCTAPITPPAQAHMGHDFPTGEWIQKVRDHEAQRNRTPIDDMINNALADMEYENGSNGSTKSEELLQLPSDSNH